MKCLCVISCAGLPKNIPMLRRCLRSIYAAKTGSVDVYVVVTTNHDPTYIKRLGALIDQVVVCPPSAGFVEINNAAIEKTNDIPADIYLFINDDAWLNPTFFSVLEKTEKTNKKADVFVPLVYKADTRRIDSFGVEYFTSGYAKNTSSASVSTTLATLSCLCVRHRLVHKIIRTYGFFLHPMLHWYFDDIEFSIRALAIGAVFLKTEKLVAHHMGTFTWKGRQPFVVYQNYRNLLWTIYVTWPKTSILKHLCSIVFIQIVLCIYSSFRFGPWMYYRILTDTFRERKRLRSYRGNALHAYGAEFDFEMIFSPHVLRTKYGIL